MTVKHTKQDAEHFGAWLTERLPDSLTTDDMEGWMRNGIATTRALRKAFCSSTGPLFKLVSETQVGATEARATDACLFGKRWTRGKPHDFTRWMLQSQPATEACPIVILSTLRESSFQEWASTLLKVPHYTPEHELEKQLLERKFTLTLPQVERLVKRTDNWAMQSLLLEEPGNFFFTPNNVSGISVVNIRCDKQHWEPYLKGFASQHQRRPGCRLIVANFDAWHL